MAPRSAKTKKVAAEAKVDIDEAPKKGRSKAKVVLDIETEINEPEVIEKTAPEKKTKRGKKTVETNGAEKTNGSGEEVPAKKGRKKIVPESAVEDNSDSNSIKSELPDVEENIDSNGHSEETAKPSDKKKRAAKKEPTEKADAKAGKGKNIAKQASVVTSQTKNQEKEKPKPKARGRKVQPKPEEPEKVDNSDEEAKTAPSVTKGRKKAAKTISPESHIDKPVVEYAESDQEAKPAPTKATKGRKKAAKPKSPEPEIDEPIEKTDSDEEDQVAPKKAAKGRKKAAKPKSPEPQAEEEPSDDVDDIASETSSKPEKKGKGQKAQAKKGKAQDKPNDEPSSKKRKTNKVEKGQGDAKEEDIKEVQAESKAKGKRGQKKVPEASEESELEAKDTGEPDTKRMRQPADDKASADEKKKATLKNKASTNYDEIDFTNTSTNPQGKEWNFKIASWNVDGIRAWMTKGGLDYVKYEKPDILCLQEVKCSKEKLPEEAKNLPGYHAYWLCSDKDGYAGVGIYTTKLAMHVQYGLQSEELDAEGRIITAEYEQFYLICTYVPNAGRKLVTLPKRLEWNEEFRKHVQELDKKKPVIICGDMNVAHNEIDLANPKTNKKNAGFTEEERSGMTQLLGDGFVDTYRQRNPEAAGAYTFWTYMMGARAKNVGWRLDYLIVSERLLPLICDSVIRDQVYGSDHCPISLFLHLTTADKPKGESP